MSEYLQVEEALYAWLKQKISNTLQFLEIIWKKMQRIFCEITKKDDFRASVVWHEKFKKRYSIRFLQMSGDKLSVDVSEMSSFIKNLNAKITKPGIYAWASIQCRKTQLELVAATSNKNICNRGWKKGFWEKPSKRITLMVCANGAGSHMLKLLAVGKPRIPGHLKKPKLKLFRCFIWIKAERE